MTLKCLLSQSVKPDEVVLWIAHEDRAQLTESVLSLKKEGLSIGFCEDLKSFKKIIPAILQYPGCFIVTADDDIYYRRTWLEELVSEWKGDTREVCCHRAHKIRTGADGLPLPYGEWELETSSPHASSLMFPTCGGGALYPPGILDSRVIEKELFLNLCPTADDVWLYWMLRLNGGMARTLGTSIGFSWPGSQGVTLWQTNAHSGGQNDVAIGRLIEKFGFPGLQDQQATGTIHLQDQ